MRVPITTLVTVITALLYVIGTATVLRFLFKKYPPSTVGLLQHVTTVRVREE
ncbi:MAG: hypothetical protein WC685_13860 [Methylobacter sp.]|jgi:hypothetical protein